MCGTTTMGNVGLFGQVLGGVFEAVGASEATALKQANYQTDAAVAATNAAYAEWQAQDALVRGDLEQYNIHRAAQQIRGAQATSFAARGVALTGSALDVLAGTDAMAAEDRSTAELNSQREAYGYQVRAANYRGMSQAYGFAADQLSPAGAMFSSLLGSAGSIYRSAYPFQEASK